MNTLPASPTSRFLRLDMTLFWLRWLFVLAAVVLALQANNTLFEPDAIDQTRFAICVGTALVGNGLLGALTLVSGGGWLLGALALVLDSALAALFFGAYEGALPPLLTLGALAILASSFRFGARGIAIGLLLLGLASGAALTQLENVTNETAVGWGVSLLMLAALGGVSVAFRGGTAGNGDADMRITEALRLRTARERARAISEMANTLGATLNHQRVLEAAQMIGSLALNEDLGSNARVMSVVLLFQGKDNKLRVIASRGMTRADENVALNGREGVLGLALKQAEPVFAGDAAHDPELQYFAALQIAKSVLAIPLRAGLDNFGVMVFGCDLSNAFSAEHRELMEAIGKQATLALQNAVLYQNLLVEKEKIVEVEEDARKKLARDLHDGPTQSVAAIAMRANYIRRLIERQPQQAVQELRKVEDLARRTTKEIRHMLFTLRPLVLETQGLVAALNQLAEKMQDTHNTSVSVMAQEDVEKFLDVNAQGVLFYIVEEAVNNARKHAQAAQILVRLYRREQSFIIVEIEDNGKGFDVKAVNTNYEQRGSLGMINMRERAELIEGTLRIQSSPGLGTKISVLIPVHRSGVADDDLQAASAPPVTLQPQQPEAGSVADRLRPAAQPPNLETPVVTPTMPAPERAARPPESAPSASPPSSTASPAPQKPMTGQRSPGQTPPPAKPISSPVGNPRPVRPITGGHAPSSGNGPTARPTRPPYPSQPPVTPEVQRPTSKQVRPPDPGDPRKPVPADAPDPRDSRPRKPGPITGPTQRPKSEPLRDSRTSPNDPTDRPPSGES